MPALMRVQTRITGLTGLPGLMTAYFSVAGSVATAAEATDGMGRVRALWNGMTTQLATGSVISPINPVSTIDDTTGSLLGLTTGTPPTVVSGTGANPLPLATQGLAQWFTATVVGGRLLRGHSNIGPLAAAANTNGLPSAAFNAALVAAMPSMATGATAIVQRVWHRPTPGLSNGSSAPVTSYGVGSTFGVLRSRRD